MTDHAALKMHREKVRIRDKEIIASILKRCHVAVVAMQDEPYPYAVPMNYGFEWEEHLAFYLHMALEGHRIDLIRKDPKVALSVYEWKDRVGYKSYRGETHDYRSVNVFGTAEIITADHAEEYLKGINLLQTCNSRKPVARITQEMKNRLYVLKITADVITAKSQYPIEQEAEIQMPENIPLHT